MARITPVVLLLLRYDASPVLLYLVNPVLRTNVNYVLRISVNPPSSRKRKSYLPSGFEAIYFDYPEREWSHEKDKRSDYDPYDNHWESSFDWQDEDGDGYDDRDDGFWNEREF